MQITVPLLLCCATLLTACADILDPITIESDVDTPLSLLECPERVPLAGVADQKELALRLLENETADDLCRQRLKELRNIEMQKRGL
jgi:hypothetical protein